MKKHLYEAVIQSGRVGMVVQYESFHRKGSRANMEDMHKAFGEKYGKVWKPDTVIHELKTLA